MKVILIAPPVMDYFDGRLQPAEMDAIRECPPYGLYMLASVLKESGHEVVLADLIAQRSRSIRRYLADLADCSLVGISATSLCWATAREIVRKIRRVREDVPIVLGGIHPTMFDRYLLREFPVDYVIRGEGEVALPALCRALERGTGVRDVPNLSWRTRDGQVVRNPLAPKIPKEQLGAFPLPDYSTLPPRAYKGLAIESSRGCALDCSFCSTSYRRTWRGIPAEQFVNRLEAIMPHLSRTLLQVVHIIDDEFSMNPRRATEIALLLRKRGLRPRLIYDSRAVDFLADGFTENIAEFTYRFLIGAECGYDEGLKRVGKGTTCQILEDAARKLRQYGISERGEFSFIIGLPWETRAEVEKTIRFAMHLFGEYGVRVRLNWYCQMPGSRLWEEDRRNQLVSETMYNEYGFYRNLYLLRSGVRLTPREIWDVGEMVSKLKWLADLYYPSQEMIQFFFPGAIEKYFPRDLLAQEDTGLGSLRQLSRPPAEKVISRITQIGAGAEQHGVEKGISG